MIVRLSRKLALASLVASGLAVGPGCTQDAPMEGPPATGAPTTVTPPGATPTTVENIEHKAGEALEKVEEVGAKVGHEIKEGAVKAVEGTGKVIESAGEKLEGSVKDTTKEHVGDKAAGIVEGAGKGLEKAGEKLQDSVKPQ